MSTQIKKIQIEENGGPEKMLWKNFDLPDPEAGQVTIKHSYIGLNYIDTYHRSGLYPLPLPSGLGMEASGQIISIGNSVSGLNIGDRISYVMELGSYATHRNISAERLVKIPNNIYNKVVKWAKLAHKLLGCSGISRSDFRYDDSNETIYMLEINTQPGMTKTSLSPEQAKYCGISLTELVDILISKAKFEKV